MKGRLESRVAIVTFNGQGICKAYATWLALEDAKIVTAELNEKEAHAVAKEVNAAGHEALAMRTGVTDQNSIEQMAAASI